MARAKLAPPPEGTTAEAVALGLSTTPLATAIDRDDHTPAIVNLLANALTWGESKVFRRLFSLGTNEWRVLSALTKYPGATATQLCGVITMNKSVMSRAATILLERRLIDQLEGARGSRHLYLTADGVRMHDAMAPVALELQAIVHADLTPAEVEQANALMLRMLAASARLQDYQPGAFAAAAR